jgi:hypothetical protein
MRNFWEWLRRIVHLELKLSDEAIRKYSIRDCIVAFFQTCIERIDENVTRDGWEEDMMLEKWEKLELLYVENEMNSFHAKRAEYCLKEIPKRILDGPVFRSQIFDKEIEFLILDEEFGEMIPAVVSFREEEFRKRLKNADKNAITEDKISIVFSSPIEDIAIYQYESEGGFTILKLWECIYTGYIKTYNKENEKNRPLDYDLTDLFIKRIWYNPNTSTIKLNIIV